MHGGRDHEASHRAHHQPHELAGAAASDRISPKMPLLDLLMLPLTRHHQFINPERDGGESEAAVSKERPDAYLEDGGEAAR